jgi:hypothetical protein
MTSESSCVAHIGTRLTVFGKCPRPFTIEQQGRGRTIPAITESSCVAIQLDGWDGRKDNRK